LAVDIFKIAEITLSSDPRSSVITWLDRGYTSLEQLPLKLFFYFAPFPRYSD